MKSKKRILTLLTAGALFVESGCIRMPELVDGTFDISEKHGTEAVTGLEPETSGKRETALDEVLPDRYDAREHGRTAPVKNQGDQGTCWAFASLLALESSLLPDETYDFSEDHMSHNPNFGLEPSAGGDYTMSMAYLLSWGGPVTEAEDPYGDSMSPNNLIPSKHVQGISLLPEHDLEAIKRSVLDYGGVQSSLYTDFQRADEYSEYYNADMGAYACPESRTPNHDVVIVGWDDHYPKERFSKGVSEDGAFLCENSWGTQFGENGFFYVSYEDGNLGKTNICYVAVEDTENYDRIHQSDLCGWIGQLGYGKETAWAVNVYLTGEKPELLKAAGFYTTGDDTDYEVYVVPYVPENPAKEGGQSLELRRKAASGHLDYSGYYTVRLDEPEKLGAGQRFGIMVKLTTKGAVHPIAIEYDTGDGKCNVDLSDGEGYISPDGVVWDWTEDLQKCNICLKAYTDTLE